MEARKKLFKDERINFAAQARARREQMLSKTRRDDRMVMLNSNRQIEETHSSAAAKESKRAEMLARWKANKEKALAEMKKNKKPAFTVGILQRKVTGSPLLKMSNAYANKNFLNPNQIMKVKKGHNEAEGVVTRSKHKALVKESGGIAREAASFVKIVNNKRVNIENHAFTVPKSVANLKYGLKITVPDSPKVLKGRNMKKRGGGRNNKENKTIERGIDNYVKDKHMKESKGKEKITEHNTNDSNIKENKNKVETLKGNEDDHIVDIVFEDKRKENDNIHKKMVQEIEDLPHGSTNTNEIKTGHCTPVKDENTGNKDEFLPIYYSPYVKKSRGSDVKSSKKEKITLSLDVDKVIEKEEKEFQCRIFSFRKYIECQTKRLLDTCDMWKNIMNAKPEIPQDAVEEILSLCGKTNLLTSDKFKQFKDLVQKCENRDPMITVEDLDGYKDWVSIEVDSLDAAFTKLEQRSKNYWREEVKQQSRPEKKEIKPLQPKNAVKRPVARSNIRELIQAARKKKQTEGNVAFGSADSCVEEKSSIKTPRKDNVLLKEVLNSEAMKVVSPARNNSGVESSFLKSTEKKKRRNSGLEIFVATQLSRSFTPGKVLRNVAEEQISVTQECVTPGKSILKKTPASSKLGRSVHFRLSNSTTRAPGLDERYLQPLADDEDNYSDLSIRMRDFSLHSPRLIVKNTSTPVRRSSRLAQKH